MPTHPGLTASSGTQRARSLLMRSGSACLSAGQPLYRVVREWP